MRWLVLLATQASCLAVSARAHVGVLADERGADLQVGATLGVGIATSSRSGVLVTPGLVAGTPKLGLVDTIEYARAGDSFAWRAGAGGTIALLGEPSLLGPHAAALLIVRDGGRSWAGHEKMGGGGSNRSIVGVGLEARGGAMTTDEPRTRSLGMSAALTAEWFHFTRWRP